MKTVQEILKLHGGIEALKANSIKIENEGFMPLVIEWIGQGPNGSNFISVAHYYEQNGDLMRDPEMVFLVACDIWTPYSYQQDNLGLYQQAMDIEGNEVRRIYPKVSKDLRQFSAFWDRNLRSQGFLKIFKGRKS
jgi:hypothetical protein